jgi:YidC/Oxa1 family membrane protein insertase
MSVRQQKPVIDRIRSKFGSHPRFSLELDVRSSQSLHEADVMISDWSGAALEFALGLERPVLFIDTPRKVNNRDYARLQCEPLEVLIRPQVGVVVSPQDLGEIPSQVATLCAHRDQFVERIREARARWIYNLGSSGRVGATAVLDALESTRNGHPRP